MATAKKNGKKNSTQKHSTGRSVKASRSNTGRAGAGRADYGGSDVPEGLYLEIAILFLLAFCIILILGNFGLTLRFGDVFNSLFFGLFGGMEYIFPFFLFAGVCFYLIYRNNASAVLKLVSSVVLFFDIGMFLQLFVTEEYNLGGYSGTYDFSASNRSGGGMMAGGLFETLQKNLGRPATVIIMIMVLLICLVVISGNSFIKLLYYPGQEIADRAKERKIEHDLDMKALREEKKLIREEEREKRSRKRAALREEKRKKLREDSRSRNRDLFSISVGDENKNADENPVTRDEAYEEGGMDAAFNEEAASAKENTESYGYSPFAISPEHMVKPRNYDKKPKQKPVPEVRRMERSHQLDSLPEENLWRESIRKGSSIYEEPSDDSEEKPYSEVKPYSEEKPDKEEVPYRDEKPDKDDVSDIQSDEEESYGEEKASDKDNDFYDELIRFHEVEDSDMHEITFSDEPFDGDKEGPVFDDYDEKPMISVREASTRGRETAVQVTYEEESNEVVPYEDEIFEDEEEEEDFRDPYNEDPRDSFNDDSDDEDPDGSAFDDPDDEDQDEDTEYAPGDKAPVEKAPDKPYELPPLSLLQAGKSSEKDSEESLRDTAEKLKNILASFGVKVRMLNYIQGPTVTRFEMQPEQGVKVNTILNLSNDIQMNLAAKDIRIEAPIPGKAAVGIEIPNRSNSPVYLRELIESRAFRESRSRITFAVGKDIGGEAVVFDIGKMPHLLIAGATGSGKSVCINTIIMSILYKAKPDEVKLIMIDPKVVELSVYNGIPHLLTPVVTDPVKAAGALNWGVQEMMKRYQLFARIHVRNMDGYNEKVPELNKTGETLPDGSPYTVLPQIVIIVDELADLMMVQKKDVEGSICRLAQLARAAGIHLIIATQRPSVDVITGLIKANMPSRVAFAVSSNVDSRTILDSAGAEKLLGNGDMLFYPQKYPKPERLQGAFVSDDEVQAVTDFIRAQSVLEEGNTEDISEEIAAASKSADTKSEGDNGSDPQEMDDGRDSYFADAGRFVTEKKKATIGILQRMFRIGFNRAARIMDQLSEAGVVSGEDGTKPRQVLMSKEEFEAFLSNGMVGSMDEMEDDSEDED